MPKRKAAPVDQLRILNELLGRVSDPHKAEHARRALEFAYAEHPQDLEHLPLGDYVDKLARLHFGDLGEDADFAFAHWHVPRLEDFSPLWIRQAIVVEMKKLAGRREGVLLLLVFVELSAQGGNIGPNTAKPSISEFVTGSTN